MYKNYIDNNRLFTYFSDGIISIIETANGKKIEDMFAPVMCTHCGKIYDLTEGKVTHRYGDCDVFTTPCCNYENADTREWKSFPDFKRLDLD